MDNDLKGKEFLKMAFELNVVPVNMDTRILRRSVLRVKNSYLNHIGHQEE
ncbi:MAG: hypothetical protein ACXAES_17315 [Promethearchaeota archaeon]